ncbi:MAG TPA: family 43 glycosylhydrolase [Bacteroidales bacterium]|nr:family 43 glycosylhydrolase [Bacteroidales bacterium]
MNFSRLFLFVSLFQVVLSLHAQNPVVRNQFSADPSARVFNGTVYVYPSHDILAREGKGKPGWFCMEDYHVFSSVDLMNWTDHGVIVSQKGVSWADTSTYSMWAPDCIYRNGKYYFYFPANNNNLVINGRKSFSIGVAVADKPEGPFTPLPEPIKGANGIDPNVFIDKDGQAYLYWALGRMYVAKLNDNMTELASEPQVIKDMPVKGLIEGPWMFERNGIYYFTYPHVENNIERLEYATGDNPMGPFRFAGVIMDESPMNCWTNHQSVFEFKGQWYLFYHQNAYSPKFDKNRSICIDSLFFNSDGSIHKVVPSNRGVGVNSAFDRIDVDRYSEISKQGSKAEFIDSLNTFNGWKLILDKGGWAKYNAVDFGKTKPKSIEVYCKSQSGGTIQIRLDKPDGIPVAQIEAGGKTDWKKSNVRVKKASPGIHDIYIHSTGNSPVEIDWIRFLK